LLKPKGSNLKKNIFLSPKIAYICCLQETYINEIEKFEKKLNEAKEFLDKSKIMQLYALYDHLQNDTDNSDENSQGKEDDESSSDRDFLNDKPPAPRNRVLFATDLSSTYRDFSEFSEDSQTNRGNSEQRYSPAVLINRFPSFILPDDRDFHIGFDASTDMGENGRLREVRSLP
jgi:hypothetical protein